MPSHDANLANKYGPWAFVAGASEGIGESFAEQLAAAGINLVMVARRRPLLEVTADRIRKAHPVEIRTHSLDLSGDDLQSRVGAMVADIEVGLLVYNAAFSRIGRFLDQPLEDHLQELHINVRGPMTLAHLFGTKMVARGKGGIILMSSQSGTQGTAMVANYAATKAYNTVLAEGLWYELRQQGVDVLACVAGMTLTPAFLGSTDKRPNNWLARPMKADDVASQALRDLGHTPRGVSGARNRCATFMLERLLPRERAIRLVSKETERMYR